MKLLKINTKTISRIATIQTLYQYQVNSEDINGLINSMIFFYKKNYVRVNLEKNHYFYLKIKLSVSYFNKLIHLTLNNLHCIDQSIKMLLKEKYKDLSNLLLAIVRVAICELKFCSITSYKIVINEFTDITSEMLNDSEVGFVNSILNKIILG